MGIGGDYFDRYGLYLIFVFCALFSLIGWICNWFCWIKGYCCFSMFEDLSNRIFVWWLSFIFLCGILASCISGFVTANRVGFSSYGVQCAYERIYYDILNGQMKTSYPKWVPANITTVQESQNINVENAMSLFKTQFMEDMDYYLSVARGVGKILTLIYFIILLIVVVGAGMLLIIYYCNCFPNVGQNFYLLPMHITWNILRFFIFSFFMYGFGFGGIFTLARDAIGYIQYIFSQENLTKDNPIILSGNSKEFFYYCLYSKSGSLCNFIQFNLNLMYKALWDFSIETRILCALSCVIAFSGVLAVYGFLWTMFLWRKNNDNDGYRYLVNGSGNGGEYNDISNQKKKKPDIKLKKRPPLKPRVPPPKTNVREMVEQEENEEEEVE